MSNVLVSPNLVTDLVSVRRLTRDNPITVEFDAVGFSVKDARTRMVLHRCDSPDELYPVHSSTTTTTRPATFAASIDLWHARLGHPNSTVLRQILQSFSFSCNKAEHHTCEACRLGKHVRLPFSASTTISTFPFQLLHSDVWTSPVASNTGYLYYLVLLDDFSHYVWTFPLRRKSDVLATLTNFYSYVATQFGRPILALQTDNGKEFDNAAVRHLLASHGTILRLTCPYTSQQNGRAERVIRTLNDCVRTLLFHSNVPPRFWPDALATATLLLNIRPCRPRWNYAPHQLLFGVPPSYDGLRIFGCLCYPSTASTTPHKLAPRSVPCIFLGYPSNTKGYRCYDPVSHRVYTSRHVYFDELVFPFQQVPSPSAPYSSAAAPAAPAPTAAPAAPPASSASSEPGSTSASPVSSSATPTVVAPLTGVVTRARTGTFRPNPRYTDAEYACTASTSTPSPLPSSARAALRDPNWLAAMREEFEALQRNRTWQLVPRPPHASVITGKWVFRHKTRPDGSLERYKARWVVRGFRQRAGVDFTDTFAPVVKPGTIRAVLQLAASRAWPVHQLDVSNAFLHGHLAEQVYCQQPTGFVDTAFPDRVCLLSRSLYGLKQAPRAWYKRIAAFLQQQGFRSTRSDASLFVYHQGAATAYLLLYVDDIILTASSPALLQQITARLSTEFALKDLGALHFFLGIEVVRRATGFFLHQQKYAHELLERAGMLNCNPAPTPVDTKAKVSAVEGSPASDAPFYRSIVGALQYLTLTRPDLQYAVQQVCLHMHAPRDTHWALVKRILRYIRGTMAMGLTLTASSDTSLVAYSDADWAGCPDTRRSTSGYCVYLGPSLISWSSKRQPTVSRSSAEAEYRAVANAVAECSWLRQLLQELLCEIPKATIVYCDNVSAVYLSANPVHHRRTKHIELDIHFVREHVALGRVRVLHVPTDQQFADVMTKGLPTSTFEGFRSSLCVTGDASTAGGC